MASYARPVSQGFHAEQAQGRGPRVSKMCWGVEGPRLPGRLRGGVMITQAAGLRWPDPGGVILGQRVETKWTWLFQGAGVMQCARGEGAGVCAPCVGMYPVVPRLTAQSSRAVCLLRGYRHTSVEPGGALLGRLSPADPCLGARSPSGLELLFMLSALGQ